MTQTGSSVAHVHHKTLHLPVLLFWAHEATTWLQKTDWGGSPAPHFNWPQVRFNVFREPDERSIFPNNIVERKDLIPTRVFEPVGMLTLTLSHLH